MTVLQADRSARSGPPDIVLRQQSGTALAPSPADEVSNRMERRAEIEPDFMKESDDVSALNSAGVEQDEEVDSSYSPPTDPVVTTDRHGNTRVLGGFSSSSMDSVDVERSSDGTLGDEAIAEAIVRELREDAATTDLQIKVQVDGGVARLRGAVADVVDAENAEEVASRVPGVTEVIDETAVTSI